MDSRPPQLASQDPYDGNLHVVSFPAPETALPSVATISQDATGGRAGEEMQILSNLAEKDRASQGFGNQSHSSQPVPPPLPRPTSPPLPSFQPFTPPPRPRDRRHDQMYMPQPPGFFPGTRLSYQAKLSNTASTVPWNMQSSWRVSKHQEPGPDTNGRPKSEEFTSGSDDGDFEKVSSQISHSKEQKEPISHPVEDNVPFIEKQNQLSATGITKTLADFVQSKMNHSLLGSSEQATLFGLLLDNIERLEWMNIALVERLEHQVALIDIAPKPVLPTIGEPESKNSSSPSIRMQILHQVTCTNDVHYHNGSLYVDPPTFKTFRYQGMEQKKLEGKELIAEIEDYLRSKPDLSFVVFKQHVCEDKKDRHHIPFIFLGVTCACQICTQERLNQAHSANDIRTEQLRVVSPVLKQALRGLATCHMDGFSVGAEGDPQMSAPYLFMYHHRTEIKNALEAGGGSEVEHLRLLNDWIETNHGKDYEEADQLFEQGFVSEAHLSKLFKPNHFVIKPKLGGNARAYALQFWPSWKNQKLYTQVWSWKYDGFDFSRDRELLSQTFDRHKVIPITDLKVFPMQYASKDLVNRIAERGKKYWSMRNGQFVSYYGMNSLREDNYNGARFMIDVKTHSRMHSRQGSGEPACALHESKEFDPFPRIISSEGSLEEPLEMLLPYVVPGFEMESKKWVKLNITQTRPISWNRKAFKRLVLDEKSKELIRALVSVHLGSKATGDIVAGKGNGLIILLHGSPGVGKTLTAESVAELSEKPLYRVTCGDIGNRPEEVERYLRTVLYLGKIWDCVLLMDEADVFLEERTMADLQRNSLVSVFLRTLESYDGILILTSNRVGTFDEAFKSRIQVALHYQTLRKKSRKQIWQNFFEMIEEENDEIDMSEFYSRIDELAEEEMNGRQIRNCLKTAQHLSKFRNEPLSWRSLSQAITTASNFQKYLKDIQGHNDDTWAREERLR